MTVREMQRMLAIMPPDTRVVLISEATHSPSLVSGAVYARLRQEDPEPVLSILHIRTDHAGAIGQD